MNLFGFSIKKKKGNEEDSPKVVSFVPKENNDGSTIVTAGGSYGTSIELSNTSTTEADLIQQYRNMAQAPEVDGAIDEIVNEFVDIEDEEMVSLDVSDKIDENIKEVLINEFDEALRLLDFRSMAYDISRRWYVDGRLKYNAIVDKNKQDEGIQELRYIDPRKLKKIKVVEQVRIGTNTPDIASDTAVQKTVAEYYLYNQRGFGTLKATQGPVNTTGAYNTANAGLKISKDSIIDVPSGYNDPNNQMVLSYLNKAIKPLNQLRTLEDASIIYTLVRAPQRRIWYIDTGDLPPAKAKQHFNEMVNLHKNKLVFDAASGAVRDERRFSTMLEDIFLPRRGDLQRGTQVTTLPGDDAMSNMAQLEYFQKNLYKSLNIPVGRLQEGETFALGRSTQITRDEVKFSKFVTRLRNKFSMLFYSIMRLNMLVKGQITEEDWDQIKSELNIKWVSSSYHEELKEAEVLNDRINSVNAIAPLVGVYYSSEWVKKNVLHMSDEEIEEMEEQMMKERQLDQMQGALDQINAPDASQDQNQQQNDDEQRAMTKEQKIQQAKTIQDQLKGIPNKSPREISMLQSASQILSKNHRK